MVNRHALHIMPIVGVCTRNVENAHRVVAPVGHGKVFAIGGGSHHFGQRTGFKHLHDGIHPRIDYGNRRGVLRIDVETAAIVRNPQIAPAVRKRTFHGASQKGVQIVVIMLKGEKSAFFSPQMRIRGIEAMVNHRQFLVGVGIIRHGTASLQRIDVIFLAIGVEMYRLRRINIGVRQFGSRLSHIQFSAHHLQCDIAVCRLHHIADFGMAHGGNALGSRLCSLSRFGRVCHNRPPKAERHQRQKQFTSIHN